MMKSLWAALKFIYLLLFTLDRENCLMNVAEGCEIDVCCVRQLLSIWNVLQCAVGHG